jgi:hypothetical protein
LGRFVPDGYKKVTVMATKRKILSKEERKRISAEYKEKHDALLDAQIEVEGKLNFDLIMLIRETNAVPLPNAEYSRKANKLCEEPQRAIEKLEGQRAKIIIELLQRDPNFLDEPWIRNEIKRWMESQRHQEVLYDAFVAKGKRFRPTWRSFHARAREWAVYHAVEDIIERHHKLHGTKLFKADACNELADMLVDNPDDRFPGLDMEKEEGVTLFDRIWRTYKAFQRRGKGRLNF